jgi:hypothetical protein
MPIEDASVRWPEHQSPYRAVARITAGPQDTCPGFDFVDADVDDAAAPGVDARRHDARFVRGRLLRSRSVFDGSEPGRLPLGCRSF